MNNQILSNPLQQLQVLINNLNEYLFKVNSIIMEINNIMNQLNNPFLNQINNNKLQNTFNNGFNQIPIQINPVKYNVIFNVSKCNEEIKRFSTQNKNNININVDSKASIQEAIFLFFERIKKKNSIDELKNKIIFKYKSQILDYNNQSKVEDFCAFCSGINKFCNIEVIDKSIYPNGI